MSGRRRDRSGPNPQIPVVEKEIRRLEAEGKKGTREYSIYASTLRAMKGTDYHRPAFEASQERYVKKLEEQNKKVAKDVKPK